MVDSVEVAGIVVRYESWTTPEELYRQDQLERASATAREQALIAFLKAKEDRPWRPPSKCAYPTRSIRC